MAQRSCGIDGRLIPFPFNIKGKVMLRYTLLLTCALACLTPLDASAQFGPSNSCVAIQNFTMLPACLGSSPLCIKSVRCKFNNKPGKACVDYVCNPVVPKTKPGRKQLG